MTIRATITSMERIAENQGDVANNQIPRDKIMYRFICSFALTDIDSGASENDSIEVLENTTVEQLWAAIEAKANVFAARDHWLDDLTAQVNQVKDFAIN